jgi:hypothetical protein
MATPAYGPFDEALARLVPYGPDLSNGMTSHAPMAAEALCALGRPDAVLPWLDAYRPGIETRPLPRQTIRTDDWRQALGRQDRWADWAAFFAAELAGGPWPASLNRWMRELAPGLAAAATHGIIRVGHAVRSLDDAETTLRLAELADGLAYLAATYQELPAASGAGGMLHPGDAIERVPRVPPAERVFEGSITSSLDALDRFPPFAPVIDLIDVSGDASSLVTGLTETFARAYLANAHDFLTAIVFVHGVTSAAAVRSLLPHLDEATARVALRYAWQAGCALYTTFGDRPPSEAPLGAPCESTETLADMAVAHGDEHAIKFTEACVREHRLHPWPGYLVAARSALDLLRAA